jgi:hypothetical protein
MKKTDTYSLLEASSSLADRLLTTNDEDRSLPPLTLANVARLSLTCVIAGFHLRVSGRSVGSAFGSFMNLVLIKSFSIGGFGILRIK